MAVLVLMHLAIALITCNLLVRLAPGRRASYQADGEPAAPARADIP